MSGKTYLYRHYDKAGLLLYVGISLSAVKRLAQHRAASNWFPQIAKVTIEAFDTRADALVAERVAIDRECPVYNVQRPLPPAVRGAEKNAPIPAPELFGSMRFAPEAIRELQGAKAGAFRVEDAAGYLSMEPEQVRGLMDAGALAYSQFGKRTIRILKTTLVEFMESRQARR